MNLEEALSKPGARDAIIKLANAMIKKAGSNAITQFNESVPIMSQPTEEKISGSGISGTAQNANQSVPSMVDQAPPASIMPPNGDPMAQPQMPQIDPNMEGAIAAQAFLGPIMDAAMQGDPNAQAIIAQTAGAIAKNTMQAAAEALMGQQVPQDPNAGMVDQMGQDMTGAVPAAQVGADAGQAPAGLPPVPQQNTGVMMDQNGQPVDAQGNPVQVDAQGNPIPAASPEQQVADQIVPDVGAQAPVGEESGKEKKKDGDKKKTEGVQTDSDKDAKKLASFNVNQLKAIIGLARMGKI